MTPSLVGDVEEFCAPPPDGRATTILEGYPAAPATPLATSRPTATFFPACSFRCRPAMCDADDSSTSGVIPTQMNEVRSIRAQRSDHLLVVHPRLATARAVPGLAYMEGNMRGPSTQDCEKSFARTGIPQPICWQKSSPEQAHDNPIWFRFELCPSLLVILRPAR